jgi:hypothetical protein
VLDDTRKYLDACDSLANFMENNYLVVGINEVDNSLDNRLTLNEMFNTYKDEMRISKVKLTNQQDFCDALFANATYGVWARKNFKDRRNNIRNVFSGIRKMVIEDDINLLVKGT